MYPRNGDREKNYKAGTCPTRILGEPEEGATEDGNGAIESYALAHALSDQGVSHDVLFSA